jgi:hypothetical protein
LLLSIISSFVKSYKRLKTVLKEIGDKTFTQIFTLSQEGITITSVKTNGLYRWFEIKNIFLLPSYISISLRNKLSYAIPRSAFATKEDEQTFFNTVNNSIIQTNKAFRNPSKPSYKWGLVGLIPLIGGINGIAMVLMGIFKYKDYKYVIMGLGGILFTVGIYGSIIYYNFGNKPGFSNFKAFFNNQDVNLTQMQINTLVKEIEFYKVQNGVYPDSLQQLNIKNDFAVSIYDPMLGDKKQGIYNYHKIGNKYTLFSSGFDEIPNTADDIYPTVDTTNTGLIVKRR